MSEKFILKIILMVLFIIIYVSDAKNVSNVIPSRLEGRIVGGIDAKIEQNPWLVSLQDVSHICGATIISKIWILTAAHCVDGSMYSGRSLSIRAGSTFYYEGGTKVNVKKVIIHDNYDSEMNNYDFALLQLNEPLVLNNTSMKAAIIPDKNERLRDRVKCQTSGWGINDVNSIKLSPVLQSVDVRIINSAICRFSYGQIDAMLTNQMICAGNWWGGKDACSGDSGGPLICDGKLVGVVSWGYSCAEPFYPGVYARVQSVRAWIEKITGI